MDQSSPSDAVLDLGKRLVDELGLVNSCDTLSRWMAHHIAELMTEAGVATGQERTLKLAECRRAILELWKARQDLPEHSRPLRDFEAIFRALESLDPANELPRYFNDAAPEAEPSESEAEARQWLKLVSGLDYSARILIRYCLGKAAESAREKGREWVKLAEAASGKEERDLVTVRIILNEADLLHKPTADAARMEAAQDRLRRIEGFRGLALALETELREALSRTE